MIRYSLIFIICVFLLTTAFKCNNDGIDYDNPTKDDIPELIQNLDIKDFDQENPSMADVNKHIALINALSKLGEDAIPALLEALKHESCLVRGGAAATLGKIGIDSDEVIYALLEMFWNEDEEDGDYISPAFALGTLHPGVKKIVPDIIAKLDDPDPIMRRKAAYALHHLGPNAGPAIDKLIEALNDEDDDVRKFACNALRKQGPSAKDAVPTLILMLKEEGFQGVALRVLEAIGPDAEEAVIYLVENINDESSGIRKRTAEALGNIRSNPVIAVPALVTLLEDEDKFVRQAAAQALGQFGPDAKDAIPALIKALKDDYPVIPAYAAEALGNIGPEPGVITALIDALEDEDILLRFWAAEALGRIGPEGEEVIPALVKALESENPSLRSYAAEALGKFGSIAQSAIPALRELLEDESGYVPVFAAGAIVSIDPEDDYVIEYLKGYATHGESWYVRWLAVTALGNAGPHANEALPVLTSLLEDEDGRVGVGAALAIAKISLDPTEPVAYLINALDNENTGVRMYAAEALGELGPDAEPALEKLKQLAEDDPSFDSLTGIPKVRYAAREAIEKITGNSQIANQ